MRTCKVVALNKDAKLIGCFGSITEAANHIGTTYATLSNCVWKRVTYKQILFVPEREYRDSWERGTTDQYKFPSKSEKRVINRQRVVDFWASKSSDVRKTMAVNLYEGGKKWNIKNRGKKVLHIETGNVYDSFHECARELGIGVDAVRYRVRKGFKIKGITLKYYDNRNE